MDRLAAMDRGAALERKPAQLEPAHWQAQLSERIETAKASKYSAQQLERCFRPTK